MWGNHQAACRNIDGHARESMDGLKQTEHAPRLVVGAGRTSMIEDLAHASQPGRADGIEYLTGEMVIESEIRVSMFEQSGNKELRQPVPLDAAMVIYLAGAGH